MAAAALAHKLAGTGTQITLIKSAEIGTVGVGEATLPHIRFFNQTLGIDEATLMARTSATFKLGIEFAGWGKAGERYIHPFGDYGKSIGPAAFHHYWTRLRASGAPSASTSLDDYSYPVRAAEANRFMLLILIPHQFIRHSLMLFNLMRANMQRFFPNLRKPKAPSVWKARLFLPIMIPIAAT